MVRDLTPTLNKNVIVSRQNVGRSNRTKMRMSKKPAYTKF